MQNIWSTNLIDAKQNILNSNLSKEIVSLQKKINLVEYLTVLTRFTHLSSISRRTRTCKPIYTIIACTLVLAWVAGTFINIYCWKSIIIPRKRSLGVLLVSTCPSVYRSVPRLWTWLCPRMDKAMGAWIIL